MLIVKEKKNQTCIQLLWKGVISLLIGVGLKQLKIIRIAINQSKILIEQS